MTFYSFDADAFITPWRYYYAPSLLPDYWVCLDVLIQVGRLKCAIPIYEEIARGGDDLSQWLRARRERVTYPWDEAIQEAVRIVQAACPTMVSPSGRSGGDPWVIALAKVTGGVVVTFNTHGGDRSIPAVCGKLGVVCLNVFDMIRKEGWVFRLAAEEHGKPKEADDI